MSDSLIRLRQLNQPELSGYIGQTLFPIIQKSGFNFSSSAFYPSGSGVLDLGTISQPFDSVYTNNITVPTNSGINFGNTFVSAYTDSTDGYISVGGHIISSSPTGISFVGPIGPQGVQGIQGATGASGVSVTGAINVNNYLKLLFSNGTTGNPIAMPSGATGASGVSLTGFQQNGNLISPLYSNATSGSPITLPAGAKGDQGSAGGINIDFDQFTGVKTGELSPNIYIANIDPTSDGNNPTINLIKGMRYSMNLSGMNLSTLVSDGTYVPAGTYNTNLFVDENGVTGYLRFTTWATTIPDYNYTGRIVSPEANVSYSTLTNYNRDSQVFTNLYEDPYKTYISFNVNMGAYENYKYGFLRYNLDGSINDGSTFGGYVLGDLKISYFGPAGPSGQMGLPGLDGPQGEPGVAGSNGVGVSITDIERNPDNIYQIRFLFSDNTYSSWQTLPNGGPQGDKGDAGPQGLQGNDGPQGIQGPKGDDGFADTYYCNFVASNVNATSGTTPSFNKRVSGQSVWNYVTGNNMLLDPGDSFQIQEDNLKNKAYSPWNRIIFADNNYLNTRYFYADVISYNPTAGIVSATVSNSPYPLGMVNGHIAWTGYGTMSVNLGGLGSPGISGASGIQGPQGIPGTTGHAVFTFGKIDEANTPVTFNLDFLTKSCYEVSIASGTTLDSYSYTFNIDPTKFITGQTAQIKVVHSGALAPYDGLCFNWDSNIRWPENVPAAPPNPQTSVIYTFVRYPDKDNSPRYYGTYSVGYRD